MTVGRTAPGPGQWPDSRPLGHHSKSSSHTRLAPDFQQNKRGWIMGPIDTTPHHFTILVRKDSSTSTDICASDCRPSSDHFNIVDNIIRHCQGRPTIVRQWRGTTAQTHMCMSPDTTVRHRQPSHHTGTSSCSTEYPNLTIWIVDRKWRASQYAGAP